jgi:hypothetical protein
MEGPQRAGFVGELEDFREDPAYKLPSPDEEPAPDDSSDPVLNPPAEPSCPGASQLLDRITEGFNICYPSDWEIPANGYVSSTKEPRWYYVGIFKFPDNSQEHQLAHVSVYVLPKFVRPLTFTRDCPQAYRVTLAGEPAVVCPEFPPVSPEARIISYHVFREDFDYFVNIATYYQYDDAKGEYTDKTDDAAFQAALQIVGSFHFTPVARADESATSTPAAGSPSP